MHWRKRMRAGQLTKGKQRKEIMDKAWGNIPLRRGSNLFSNTSRASVPSSIRSSLVMTPMVRWPMEKKSQTYLIKQTTHVLFSSVHRPYRLPNLATQELLNSHITAPIMYKRPQEQNRQKSRSVLSCILLNAQAMPQQKRILVHIFLVLSRPNADD